MKRGTSILLCTWLPKRVSSSAHKMSSQIIKQLRSKRKVCQVSVVIWLLSSKQINVRVKAYITQFFVGQVAI